MLAGVFTVADNDLFKLLRMAWTTQRQKLEPSAAAALCGPEFLARHGQGQRFQVQQDIESKMARATHILWTTGGSFVPEEQIEAFLRHANSMK
jgi:D-serine dehydratase